MHIASAISHKIEVHRKKAKGGTQHTVRSAIFKSRKLAKSNVQTSLCDRREPANASSLYLAVTPCRHFLPSTLPADLSHQSKCQRFAKPRLHRERGRCAKELRPSSMRNVAFRLTEARWTGNLSSSTRPSSAERERASDHDLIFRLCLTARTRSRGTCVKLNRQAPVGSTPAEATR